MTHYQGSVPDTRRKPDWRDHGACLSEDPELFFPKGYEGQWQLVIEGAKAVCRRCPVIEQCREWALQTREPDGVWGGLDEKERRNILRQRARGTNGGRRASSTKAAA